MCFLANIRVLERSFASRRSWDELLPDWREDSSFSPSHRVAPPGAICLPARNEAALRVSPRGRSSSPFAAPCSRPPLRAARLPGPAAHCRRPTRRAAAPDARAWATHGARPGQNVGDHRDCGSVVVGCAPSPPAPPDGHTLGLTPMTAIVVRPLVRNSHRPEASRRSAARTERLGVVVPPTPRLDLPRWWRGPRTPAFPSASRPELPAAARRVARAARRGEPRFHPRPLPGRPAAPERVAGRAARLLLHVVASASELIDSGRLRLIAVFSRRRHPDYPDVPTAREQGLDAEQSANRHYRTAAPEPVLDRLEVVPHRRGPGLPPRRREHRVVELMPRTTSRAWSGRFANSPASCATRREAE